MNLDIRAIRDLIDRTVTGRKRKRIPEDHSFLSACEHLGRFFPRDYILFVPVHTVFAVGAAIDRASDASDKEDDDDEHEDPLDLYAYMRIYTPSHSLILSQIS